MQTTLLLGLRAVNPSQVSRQASDGKYRWDQAAAASSVRALERATHDSSSLTPIRILRRDGDAQLGQDGLVEED
jgi:hypothetical protein